MNTRTSPLTVDLFVRRLVVVMAAGTVVALSACNTVEGAGRDIEAAGDGIEDAASDAKD